MDTLTHKYLPNNSLQIICKLYPLTICCYPKTYIRQIFAAVKSKSNFSGTSGSSVRKFSQMTSDAILAFQETPLSGCCVPGSCTTPTCVGPGLPGSGRVSRDMSLGQGYSRYSTLQNHHRASGYSLMSAAAPRDSCCNPRFNLSGNYATLRRGLYPCSSVKTGANGAVSLNKSEFGHTKGPQISPGSFGVSTSSSVVSSELNHSVTTSDTSDVSSERDRESEV